MCGNDGGNRGENINYYFLHWGQDENLLVDLIQCKIAPLVTAENGEKER